MWQHGNLTCVMLLRQQLAFQAALQIAAAFARTQRANSRNFMCWPPPTRIDAILD